MTANRRLLRTEALLGKAGIEKLQNSTVMIVGLGAVGGYALEALARSGIGHLILVDFDVIEETNVNRQILAVGSTIGMLKTEAARVRVREINPDCRVEILNLKATPVQITKWVERGECYRGYHMNKLHWHTTVLDGHLSDETLFSRITQSFLMTK